ncbi:MAG: hypothetical protein CME70_01475 [Halobacteriovorax sp.]|nr:hypothetical protein [Halobacteriovorax sp.]|tara:strand:- start:3707 stop:4501 length:795 start_codon:yes stop_codon:yes gene_type:complete
MMREPKLLIKFPTRGRPKQFFYVLTLYYQFMKGKNYEFVISCDLDDPTMNNDIVRSHFKNFKNLTVSYSNNKNKVEAINADLRNKKFDILLLASDDMVPEIHGYDNIIRNCMAKHYHDTDGVLWFYDGHRSDLNTLCILGKKYYDRFGYIYNPEYKTWFCDNEFTQVAHMLKKHMFFKETIIRHMHPDFIKQSHDETFDRNNTQEEISHDEKLFLARQEANFGVPEMVQKMLEEAKMKASTHKLNSGNRKSRRKNKSKRSKRKR